jgi:hypothetical protein
VHGEEQERSALSRRLKEEAQLKALLPARGERIEL